MKCRCGAVVAQILRKGSGLKSSEHLHRLFVCPDRSEEEREKQRKLFSELQRKIADEPDMSHLIRDMTIVLNVTMQGDKID